MINLIPPAARAKVTSEYWMRVSIVWLALFLATLVIIAIVQVPSYVLLTTQMRDNNNDYTTAKDQAEDFSNAEDGVKEANTLAQHIYHPERFLTPSKAIDTLTSLAGQDVTLVSFNVAAAGGEVTSVTIRGVAATRSVLASFSQSITDNTLFSEANVPISNLVNDRNIDFELTVLPEVVE